MIGRALDRLGGWHETWASPPGPERSGPSPAPRGWRGGGFLRGVNLPWLNYGGDFGANAWRPAGGVAEPVARAALREHLTRIAGGGAAAVRWFVLCDGRAGLRFDASGLLAGLDDFVIADLDAALDELARAGLQAILVLLDFHWFAPARREGAVQLGGRRGIVLRPKECGRLLDEVLRPIVERCTADSPVLAWDLLNEPEWVTSGFGGVRRRGAISRRAMSGFLGKAADTVRDVSAQAVTVGLASTRGLDLVRGLALDFYQVHWYDQLDTVSPLDRHVAEFRLDGPVMLGEFPTRGSARTPDDILSTAHRCGYAGALGWSALAE